MSWTKTRSALGVAARLDPQGDHTELRRQLKAEKLEDHIKRVVDSAPALSTEQRERLARVLQGGGAGG